jgi:hypothetical protein
MYLILSVAFFLIASVFDPGKDLALDLGGDGAALTIKDGEADKGDAAGDGAATATPGAPAPDAATPAPAKAAATPPATPEAAAAQKAGQSVDAGKEKLIESILRRVPAAEREKVRRELLEDLKDASPEKIVAGQKIVADPCNVENFHLDVGFLKPYEPRLRQACNKIVTDQESFGRALWENLPKMMFIFLPLIAMVMSVLYIGSGRYYVEHLLFFVHYHAFFFLAGIAVLLLDRFGAITPPGVAGALNGTKSVLEFALIFYIPFYLFRAMRRVYGQGRFWTATKFSVLVVAYLVCTVLTGVGLLFYTALSLA